MQTVQTYSQSRKRWPENISPTVYRNFVQLLGISELPHIQDSLTKIRNHEPVFRGFSKSSSGAGAPTELGIRNGGQESKIRNSGVT